MRRYLPGRWGFLRSFKSGAHSKNTQEGPLAENSWSPRSLQGDPRCLRSSFLAANLGGCCSDSRSESVNTSPKSSEGRKRAFSRALPLAPHLSKINRPVCFGLAKMLKQITRDTSHSTSSEVKTAIFLPEHAEYLDIKINHLSRPCWCVR